MSEFNQIDSEQAWQICKVVRGCATDEQFTELSERVEKIIAKLAAAEATIYRRNEIENKAHALFTEPLSNGQQFAHTPDQCNPLGFVKVMRAFMEKKISGEHVANPFILLDEKD